MPSGLGHIGQALDLGQQPAQLDHPTDIEGGGDDGHIVFEAGRGLCLPHIDSLVGDDGRDVTEEAGAIEGVYDDAHRVGLGRLRAPTHLNQALALA